MKALLELIICLWVGPFLAWCVFNGEGADPMPQNSTVMNLLGQSVHMYSY